MTDQQYCISARNRSSGFTEMIVGPMSKVDADGWRAVGRKFAWSKTHKYFRTSKYPFKKHKKS